jgi:hypothetical protein
MATITFDTLKFVRKLQESGFEQRQAEGIAEAFKEASGEAELATKRDIERLEAKIDRIDTRLGGELTLVKWMMGLILGGVLALIMRAFFPA